jgi:hypothetical protein
MSLRKEYYEFKKLIGVEATQSYSSSMETLLPGLLCGVGLCLPPQGTEPAAGVLSP